MRELLRFIGSALVLFYISLGQAWAVDVSPADYTALPPGTDAIVWYQQHGKSDVFRADGGADSKRSTGLKSDTSILRLIHFTEIAGVTVDPQILIPYAHIYDAKLGGQGLGSASGFADPIVGATFWVVNQPGAGVSGRYVGITPLVTIPVGEYDKDKGLNVGGNRWVGDLQVGWIEPLGGRFSMEWFGDVVKYGDNKDAGDGNQTLKQDDTYQVQTNLRYDINPTQRVALGYSASQGGKQYLSNQYTGQKTEVQQVRLEMQQMLGSKFQVAGQLTHDTRVAGGFEKDLGINLRLLFIL